MKWLIVLALIAITSAVPFSGWSGMSVSNSPYYHHPYWSSGWSGISSTPFVAAKHATENVHNDQIGETQHAIHDLYTKWHHPSFGGVWPSGYGYGSGYGGGYGSYGGGYPWWKVWSTGVPTTAGVVGSVAHHETQGAVGDALTYLEEDVDHQYKHTFPFLYWTGLPSSYSAAKGFHNIIEGSVAANMVVKGIQHEGAYYGVYIPTVSGFTPEVFHIRLQKLIDEHNVDDIQSEISHHWHYVKIFDKLHVFLQQQIYQIEAQTGVVGATHVVPTESTQKLHEILAFLKSQENFLVRQKLAHEIAITQLQKGLISLQTKVQHDTVAEHVEEGVADSTKPWSHGFGNYGFGGNVGGSADWSWHKW